MTLIVEHHQCLEAYQQQEHQDFPKLLPLSSSQEHSLPDTREKKRSIENIVELKRAKRTLRKYKTTVSFTTQVLSMINGFQNTKSKWPLLDINKVQQRTVL